MGNEGQWTVNQTGGRSKSLDTLKLQDESDYIKIGIDIGGKRAVEGLLPNSILQSVWSANAGLVQQLASDSKDESENAKKQLKKLYLAEFKANAKPGDEYYKEFYQLTAKLNRAFRDK